MRGASPIAAGLASALLVAGCPGGDPAADAGVRVDAPGLDAPGLDAPGLLDAFGPDAHVEVPAWIGVTHGTEKIRPSTALPASQRASIEAARNEWEPFQIAFDGGTTGRTITSVTASALVGPATIAASQLFVHVEGLANVPSPSNAEGATGPWPDALLPAIDLLDDEPRTVFPLEVPAGERRAVWIDVLVPMDAAPGDYAGLVTIESTSAAGTERASVPVSLHVFDFALPSTPTLRTMFGGPDDTPCIAHHDGAWTGGAWDACADTDPDGDGDRLTERYRQRYMQLALEYRVSLGGGVYVGPRDASALAHFDDVYGGLLDGTATRHLRGSALTTLEAVFNGPPDATRAALLVDHARTRGWGALVFDYTTDEPESQGTCPDVGRCPLIEDRAAIVRPAGVRPLVTAQLRYASAHGFDDVVDVLVPIVNYTRPADPDYPYQPRSDYDAWLAGDPARTLFWYQSCMSHGCGGDRGVCGSASEDVVGYPSYVLDTSAVQNRAMEWLSFTRDIAGELYFATTFALDDAWNGACAFSGAGDGTLFYAGTTERLGGTEDVPVASIRMALIREGLEDYEYLHLLESLGGGDDARRIAGELFPEVDRVTERSGDALMAARHALALAIESR